MNASRSSAHRTAPAGRPAARRRRRHRRPRRRRGGRAGRPRPRRRRPVAGAGGLAHPRLHRQRLVGRPPARPRPRRDDQRQPLGDLLHRVRRQLRRRRRRLRSRRRVPTPTRRSIVEIANGTATVTAAPRRARQRLPRHARLVHRHGPRSPTPPSASALVVWDHGSGWQGIAFDEDVTAAGGSRRTIYTRRRRARLGDGGRPGRGRARAVRPRHPRRLPDGELRDRAREAARQRPAT